MVAEIIEKNVSFVGIVQTEELSLRTLINDT